MKAFKYKGVDGSGERVSGELAGETLEEVERKLVAQDLTIISIAPSGARSQAKQAEETSHNGVPKPRGRKRVPDSDSAMILRNLAVMAETGVPFVEALDAVAASARTPQIEAAIKNLKIELVGGKSLSAAMRSATYLFPEIVSDMVKVAEEGGRLDNALNVAAGYLERSADLRKRIMNAMLYPMVMLAVSALTVLVMIVFVMPRFANIFSKMGADIPITTKALLALGDLVRGNPIQTVVAIIAVIVGIKFALRVPKVAKIVAKGLLRVPMLGALLQNLALSRSFQSISTLLNSNVALMTALEHGAKIAGNQKIEQALLDSRHAVEHGGALSEAMEETKAFPKMLIQMVSVGERTGRLGQLLAACANRMEQDVDARLKALVSIVEPVMIVVMGLIVGVITVSIIMPIYSVVQNIK
jgi:type IV pilus assembly protein PilC